jgi:hypothetical protein
VIRRPARTQKFPTTPAPASLMVAPPPSTANTRSLQTPLRAAEFILQTFEQRRNQLVAKATISATAASGVIVLVLQTMLQPSSTALVVRVVALVAVLLSALSLIEGLNIIRTLSKKSGKSRSKAHVLYFGAFAKLDVASAVATLAKMDDSQYLAELGAQAVSIAKNLRMRYDALGKAYRWLALSVLTFGAALAVQQIYHIVGALTG